jgi:zinc/manganese transport system permease protein
MIAALQATQLLAVGGLGGLLAQPFMQHAFLAGTGIALASGLAGYFLVLRAQVFTGDALSHVAFTGAMASLAFGADLRLGLFVGTVGVALLIGLLGPRGRADDVVVGNVFAWVLGLGVLFLSVYTTNRSTSNSTGGIGVLFGSIFGLSSNQALVALGLGMGLAVLLVALARPLLFATIDPDVASARGVPVRALGLGFLALLGGTAGEATQAIGALLLLGLLTAPAATALRMTTRPYVGLALSAGLAVIELWLGLVLSYLFSDLPPSFCIMVLAAGGYGLSRLVELGRLSSERTAGTPRHSGSRTLS